MQSELSTPPEMHGAYTRQLDWLIELAQHPGWKAYAWARAKELDADQSGLFEGIAQDLKNAMTGQARDTASVSP